MGIIQVCPDTTEAQRWLICEDVGQPVDFTNLDFITKKRYLYQALQGLKHLHDSGIAQGDFKFDNICLGSDDIIRICDFDCATAGPDDGQPWIARMVVSQLEEDVANEQFA